MFVGVVVENFHKCRARQEQEERARRAAKRAKKLERKRRSMKKRFGRIVPNVNLSAAGSYLVFPESGFSLVHITISQLYAHRYQL